MILHTKQFGIYHWDTFDNTTILVGETDNTRQALAFVRHKYGDHIRSDGADRVEIVNKSGDIVRAFSIG